MLLPTPPPRHERAIGWLRAAVARYTVPKYVQGAWLGEPATVTFAFIRSEVGRGVGKRCVTEIKRNARNRRCPLSLAAGTLSFTGRPARTRCTSTVCSRGHRKMKPGNYRMAVTAMTAGRRSSPRTISFSVVSA